MSIKSFYDKDNWGNLYGVAGDHYNGGHHGHDLIHDAGTKIPALRGGTVKANKTYGSVGRTLAIRHGLGDYDGYCHLYDRRVGLGDVVKAGDTIALVAGAGDQPGSAWTGPHLHFVHGITPLCVVGLGTTNPKGRILSAIESSSDDGDLAPADTTITPIPIPEESEMKLIKNKKDGKGYLLGEFSCSPALNSALFTSHIPVFGPVIELEDADCARVIAKAQQNGNAYIAAIANAVGVKVQKIVK